MLIEMGKMALAWLPGGVPLSHTVDTMEFEEGEAVNRSKVQRPSHVRLLLRNWISRAGERVVGYPACTETPWALSRVVIAHVYNPSTQKMDAGSEVQVILSYVATLGLSWATLERRGNHWSCRAARLQMIPLPSLLQIVSLTIANVLSLCLM